MSGWLAYGLALHIMLAVPYPQTPAKMFELLNSVFANPEIAVDLEQFGVRRAVVKEEMTARSEKIWHGVAARIEEVQLTEHAIASFRSQESVRIPAKPSYLYALVATAGTCIVLLVLGFVLGLAYGYWKGWHSVAQHWLPEALVAGGLIMFATVLLLVHHRRDQYFSRLRQDKENQFEAEMSPLTEKLESAIKLADTATEQALLSEVREFLESRKGRRYGEQLPDSSRDGLAQVLNPEFEITTPASAHVRRLVETMQGASIGISGARGAGKTTLLWSLFQTGNSDKSVLSVFTSAPVQYEPREFVLHLFGSVCSRIIEKQLGRRDSIPVAMPGQQGTSSVLPVLYRFSRLGPVIAGIGVFLLSTGIFLAYAKINAAAAAAAATAARTPEPFYSSFLNALNLSPGVFVQWGFLFLVAQFLMSSFLPQLRRRMEAERPLDPLNAQPPLVQAAARQLSDIRFQQSYTSGWSGSFKLPMALEGGVKSDQSWSERQKTLPDIVDEYRRFLDEVVASEKNVYKRILICIDELDKLESDEAAQRFLNGIKSVFNQSNCYYFVSVSENAMSSFERRGLPIRDAFDSSFDEVIYVDYLDLAGSKRLLSRRVLNVPHPYICFCHVVAGGLPRDLIRVCRALFDAREHSGNLLSSVCASVVYREIEAKLRAMAVAAQRQPAIAGSFPGSAVGSAS